MRKLVSLVASLMLISVAFLLGGCGDPYKNVAIDFSSESIEIVLGVNENDTTSILATVTGFQKGASNAIMFSPLVNNVVVTSVTDLGNGNFRAYIKAIQPGTASIKVTTLEGNKSSYFSVTVIQPIQSFGLKSDIAPFVLKKAGESATKVLNGENLFAFVPTNTTQKQVQFSLVEEIEGASIENGVLSLSELFTDEQITVVATSFSNPDLVSEFVVKVVEPIEAESILINGVPMSEGSQQIIVANSLDYSSVTIEVQVDITKQVFATLTAPQVAVSNESNFQITENIVDSETMNVFSWNVWIKTLGLHQLTLTLAYGGFTYTAVFANDALIVNVVNQPTDVLFDNVSLAELNNFNVFNKYAPLLLGTMFNVSVSPFNVLPVNAIITISQEGLSIGEDFEGLEIYAANGDKLSVGSEIVSGSNIFIRGKSGESGVQTLKFDCKNIFASIESFSRSANFRIYEGIDEMTGSANMILEIVSADQEPTLLPFYVYPVVSQPDGFGISVTNANLVVDENLALGELLDLDGKIWRQINLPVTPKVEGNTQIVVYSGNGYYITFQIEVVTRISEAAFKIPTYEENKDVRQRTTAGYLSSGLQTLSSAVISSASTGVALSLIRYPVQARASVEYQFCDYVYNESSSSWVAPALVAGQLPFGLTSQYIAITSSKIVPTNINGGKVVVKAFVKTTIVDEFGSSIFVYLSPNGTFFTLVDGKYYEMISGLIASPTNPAWFTFSIETFVPISRISINQSIASLSSISSVGYYNNAKSSVSLSVTVSPTNATHAKNIVWQANRDSAVSGKVLFNLQTSETKTSATFTALNLRAYETTETARVKVQITELGDRVFEQSCEISWKSEEMVSDVVLHNTDTTNGIYIENFASAASSFTILATAYPTTAFNRNLRYAFIPDGTTPINFLSVDPLTGEIEVMQSGSGKGTIQIAPEDRFQSTSGNVSAAKLDAFDDTIKSIPIVVVDGSSEEFAIRIFDADKFQTIRTLPNLFYVLCTNITLTNFVPIQTFMGSLNGTYSLPISTDEFGNIVTENRTHSITLNYDNSNAFEFVSDEYFGLIFTSIGSYVYEDLAEMNGIPTVKNLFLKVNFNQPSFNFEKDTAKLSVGVLAGLNLGEISNVTILDYSEISKSIFSCGNAQFVGAFAGTNANIISECTSNMIISANASVGGIAGQNIILDKNVTVPGSETPVVISWEGNIFDVRNMGRVVGMGEVGGIVAQNSAIIENAFVETVENNEIGLDASAIVGNSGSTFVGGIAGRMTGGNIGLSYFTSYKFEREIGTDNFFGDIYAATGSLGGIVGTLENGAIDQCFANGSLFAEGLVGDAYVGGIAGWFGNETQSVQPQISNSYTLGKYSALSGQGTYLGNFVGYNSLESVGTVTKSYSLATDTSGINLTNYAITENVLLTNSITSSFLGSQAEKVFETWQTTDWNIQLAEETPASIWSYGVYVLLIKYPFLTFAKAPIAPTAINSIQFGTGTSYVPFKKNASPTNNAAVLFFYETLSNQTLTTQMRAKIVEMNTLSLAWSVVGGRILLGSFLSFATAPADSTKDFDHYTILSSNPAIVKVVNNSSLQVYGIGSATIRIVSKLNSNVFAEFDVEIAYPQGDFKIFLGTNSESGQIIKSGNVLKIKRTFAQRITTVFNCTKAIDGVSVAFKVETVSVSFTDTLNALYDGLSNVNMTISGRTLGVHTVLGNVSSESGYFPVKATLTISRTTLSDDAKANISILMSKLFNIKVWTGAEEIVASQSSFEVEPIIAPVFEFSIVSDAQEIVVGDELSGGGTATEDDATIVASIEQSHEKPVIFGTPRITRLTEIDNGNGFTRTTFSIELTYLSDWHKALIKENMSYRIIISSTTSQDETIFAVVTVIVIPQSLYTVSMEHYYVSQENDYYNSGVGEYDFSPEPSNTIVPGASGLLAIELFPFYSSWDYISINYTQEDGKTVNFEPLTKLESGLFAPSTSTIYEILDNGIRVQRQEIIEEEIDAYADGQAEVGMFYARLLIGTDITRNTRFVIVVGVYFEGVLIGSQSMTLTAQYLPGATFEIDGISGNDQLLPRGQDYQLDVVLIGEDRLSEVEIVGASENYNPGYSSSTDLLYRAVCTRNTLPTQIFDEVTHELIGTTVNYTLTLGVLCEQALDEYGNKLDDGYIYIIAKTIRIINGKEEEKDSTISIKVVDYVIESISLSGVNSEVTVFENSVEIDKQLAFDYSFKGIDSDTGYFKYARQTIEGTAARDSENSALTDLALLRENLSNVSPKNGLYIVNGNTESSLISGGTLSSLVSSYFSVREDYNGERFVGFIITGRNYSTTSMRFKQEVSVPGGVTLVYAFDFSILIDVYTDEDKPALIYTYDDLARAVAGNSNDAAAKDYILMADISLPADFTAFASTEEISSLDGNNKVISFYGFDIPASNTETDLKTIKLSLFDVVSQTTILKNMFLNIGNLPVIDLEETFVGSLVFAPFAITNSGIITNCHVQNFSTQSFGVSGKGNLQIANLTTASDQNVYMSGFVRTNTSNGSITNSSFGGSGSLPFPRESLVNNQISIVGSGNIAGFVNENNGRIVSSSALNFSIVNNTISSQNVYSSGFVGTNSGSAKISCSQAKDINYYSDTSSVSGISSIGIRSGFVRSNSGEIEDCLVNFNFTNSSNEIGGYTAGFVYQNSASGTITTSYANTTLNTGLLGQTEFSGIDERAASLNEGAISLSYYYSRNASGTLLNSEDSFKTGANSIYSTSNEANFLGFNIATSESASSNKFGIWKIENDDINLIDANTPTVSIREAKIDPTNTNSYILPYHSSTQYGTETNPILIKTADEFNRFISDPSEISSMKDNFYSYGTTFTNSGTFRLVRDLDFSELSASGTNDVKLGTVRLSLVGGSIQGNGFVIYNLDVSSNGLPTTNRTSIGLFKSLEDHASIKNLTIEVKNVSGNDFERVGVVAGTLKSSYLVNVVVRKTNENSKVIGKNIVGGVVGVAIGDCLIKNVQAEMIVEATHTATNVNNFISNNLNISTLSIAGGVVGVNDSIVPEGLTNNFEQVVVYGNFQIQAMIAGGVCGVAGANVMVMDSLISINSGTTFVQKITSTNLYGNGFAGGFAGESKAMLNHVRIEHTAKIQTDIDNGIATYYAQTNTNAVRGGNEEIFSSSRGFVGGLVGIMTNGQIINSYVKVSVVAPLARFSGGIVGFTAYSDQEKDGGVFVRNDIEDVYFFGDVQASVQMYANAGGLIGYNTAVGLRIKKAVVTAYLRMRADQSSFARVVGANASGGSVDDDFESTITSVNSVPTGTGTSVSLSPVVGGEAVFELKNLVPAEVNYFNISQTFENLISPIWTRKTTEVFPKLAFGVPAENTQRITSTADILEYFDNGIKGNIYILDPADELTTIAWPENFQPRRFSGIIRSAEGKTITITNVQKTLFKRVSDSKFLNFNISVANSVATIYDAVFADEIEKCIFSGITISGQTDINLAPVTTIKQTVGNFIGMGVIAQKSFVTNEFENLIIKNFNLTAPVNGISAKEIGVGGVIGVSSGSLSFSKKLEINNVNIQSNANIITPSTYRAGLLVGDSSLGTLSVQVIEDENISSISGKIDFSMGISSSVDTILGSKGIVSVGGVVGECTSFTQSGMKIRAQILVSVTNGTGAIVSIGGFAGKVTTKASITNSSFGIASGVRDEIVCLVNDNQLVAFGGAIGKVEGELSITNTAINSNMLIEYQEDKSIAAVGGIIGRIASASKYTSDKTIKTCAFTGLIFVKAANSNIGGILGEDSASNIGKTVIEFCRVGDGDIAQKSLISVSTAVGYNWGILEYYYSGSITLFNASGETNIGGLVGVFGKIGANGTGSSAEKNLTFGDINFVNVSAISLNVGGVVGNAANNYINENISLTSIKLANKKEAYFVGAIVGKVGSNSWTAINGKSSNIFSHQISLAVQDEVNANLVNTNMYVKRTISINGSDESLYSALDNFVNTTHNGSFPGFSFSQNDPSQTYGTKLNPVQSNSFSTLMTEAVEVYNTVSDKLAVLLFTGSVTNSALNMSSFNGMMIGDGFVVNRTVANMFYVNNGYISGLGINGNASVSGTSINGKGLLVGRNNGIILGCYSNGSLTGSGTLTSVTGGLVGINTGIIKDSFSHANLFLSLSSCSSAGGLAGYGTATSFIETSYSTGVIDSQYGANASFVGDFASENSYNRNCWTSAVVLNSVGKIVLTPFSSNGTYKNCYYDKSAIGETESIKGVKEAKNYSDLTNPAFAKSISNSAVCLENSSINHKYPSISSGMYAFTSYMAVAGNPANIFSEVDMNTKLSTSSIASLAVKKLFIRQSFTRASNWVPQEISGTELNGLSKIITTLTVEFGTGNRGLFSQMTSSTIRNLSIQNAVVSGTNAGVFAGVASGSHFFYCSSLLGAVESYQSSVGSIGGIVGKIEGSSGSTLSNCSNSANITNNTINLEVAAGGLVGKIAENNVTISGSTSNCNVTAQINAGGFVGFISGSSLSISDSISGGTIRVYQQVSSAETSCISGRNDYKDAGHSEGDINQSDRYIRCKYNASGYVGRGAYTLNECSSDVTITVLVIFDSLLIDTASIDKYILGSNHVIVDEVRSHTYNWLFIYATHYYTYNEYYIISCQFN